MQNKTTHIITKAAVNIARLLMAATFIISGYVKAIDPLGTQYKFADYAEALGVAAYLPEWATLLASVVLSTIEFAMGIFLLFAIRRHLVSRLATLFMAAMTLTTLWIVIDNPVKDCGCFGDAIVLTNAQTFAKNIVLMGMALLLLRWPDKMVRFISKPTQWIVINYTILFAVALSAWSLWDLPLFDFRPYHIGANIKKGMEIPADAKQPEFETTFILEKNGEHKEFTLDNYPDSTWTFIDSKTVQTSEGYVPPIHDFSIEDRKTGKDITDEILNDTSYTFLLISPRLDKADDSNFGQIDQIYEYAKDYGYRFICLTASTEKDIAKWQDITGAEYPFYTTDATTLKTMIRSNPGLILLHHGTIIQKWSHNNLPGEEQLSAPLEKSEAGQIQQSSVPRKVLTMILWFVLPLVLLTIADRLWAWSTWLRKKNKANKLISTLNKKEDKMRKKIVAGNWKMNKNLQEGVALAKELTEVVKTPNCDVIIGTPFIHLASVAEVIKGSCIQLSAENCANHTSGAYTGEVSAEMVKSTGAEYVILGHSERREYYNETPEILKEKVELALANGLKVIFCIGESLEQREANKQNEVVKAELAGSVFHLDAEAWKNIIIAYEPIWAIGTGKTATAEQAEEIHAYIRSCVAEVYGAEAADNTSILYGGSCKASNAPELFAKPDIDGGLIGGASLKAADFKGIIDAWNK